MPRPTARTQIRAQERGFTVIELMIALVIIAILIAIAINVFGGAKKATYAQEGKAVGSAYMQVLSQYHADFANRHPTVAKWSGANTAAAQRGPLNLTDQPYMKTPPDAVAAGRVGVSVNSCAGLATPAGATLQTAWVHVCYGAEPRAAIHVVARKDAGSPWTAAAGATICYMGATTSTPKC